jgi:hypothetical protein
MRKKNWKNWYSKEAIRPKRWCFRKKWFIPLLWRKKFMSRKLRWFPSLEKEPNQLEFIQKFINKKNEIFILD